MDDGKILLLRFAPLALQAELRLFVLGKDEDPGSLPVQPMHDEHAVSGAGAALADVIRQDEIGRARLVPLGADGQESRRLVHHEDVSVLVEYHEAVRQKTWTGAFTHGE